MTGLNLNAVTLHQDAIKDFNGLTPDAIENTFLPLGYTYHGNQYSDILLATDVSGDGVPLDFSGSDVFYAGDGADSIYTGGGSDTGYGGRGNDKFEGGANADKLYGQAGNDKLYGQGGADNLVGGAGNDTLDGGVGNDKVNGGTGSDDLTGGTGNDTFIFIEHDGVDMVNLFDVTRDVVQLAASTAHSFVAIGGDTQMDYGVFGDRVIFLGLDISQSGSIVFV